MRWSVLIVLVVACGGDDGTVACTPADHEYIDGCNLYDCTGSDACDGVCGAGATCGTLDCSHDAQCRLDCQEGATCKETDCRNTGTCFVDCHGLSCDTKCDGSMHCSVECRDGAQCLLDCGSSPDCQFQPCVGMTTQCANNVQVCNRACP